MKKAIPVITTLVIVVLCVLFMPAVIVYAEKPVIDNVQASNITPTSAVISWTTDVNATSRVVYDTVTHNPGTPDDYADDTDWNNSPVKSHGITLSGFTGAADTIYYYRVVSRIDASDQSTEEYSAEYSFQNSDTTSPGIIDLGVTILTTSGATIVWQTDEPATTQIEYGLDTSYGQSSSKDNNLNTLHIVILDGLTPGTQYFYQAKSEDVYGNDNTGTGDFTTSAFSITGISANTGETTATISWTSGELSTSQVEYGLDISYDSTSPLDSTNVKKHCVVLIGLTPDNTYHYRVISEDEYGNVGKSGDYTFTTIKDTTPPTLSEFSVDNITTSSAIISWMTNELTTGRVEFGLTTDYGSNSTIDTTFTTEHVISLIGLDPGTTYHYRIKSVDASDNEAMSGDYTFTTTTNTAAGEGEGSQVRFYIWAIAIGAPLVVVFITVVLFRRRARS